MNTDCILKERQLILKERRAAGEAAKRRRLRNAELMEFLTGSSLVLAGLLLATVYELFAHRIPV
jgi:hypothetical protein